MKVLISALVFLVGCGGVGRTPDLQPCPVATTPLEAGAPDAAPEAATLEPCTGLRTDKLAPTTVFYGQAHNTVITAHGCFKGVQDVEVSVESVAFQVLDDGATLVFLAAPAPLMPGQYPLPYGAEVDIIVKPATQIQTFITYTE